MNKAEFAEAAKLKNTWNKLIDWNGYRLGTVLWHEKPWKLVELGTSFETVADRQYKPIAEFRTQQELWQYIKAL